MGRSRIRALPPIWPDRIGGRFSPVNRYEYGQVSPTVPYVDGADNWGTSGAMTRYFMCDGHRWRIRQNGTIKRVRIFTKNKTNALWFKVEIWRKDGATFDLVGQTEDILPSLVIGDYATIDLESPIEGVLEGDYIGYSMQSSGISHPFCAGTGLASVSTWYVNAQPGTWENFDWLSQNEAAGVAFSFDVYMTAPTYAGIGDSLMAGHTGHYSFVEVTGAVDLDGHIMANMAILSGYAAQNMGVGAQTTTQIEARFAADCLALNPYYAVINGGVNDIAGAGAKATFIAKWTAMLAAAQADSSVKAVAVCLIAPWTNGTNPQMQTRDDWNADLVTLCASYSKAIPIDLDTALGQFRAGGDPGNLWDIKAAYDVDGVHLNAAGYAAYAQEVLNAL